MFCGAERACLFSNCVTNYRVVWGSAEDPCGAESPLDHGFRSYLASARSPLHQRAENTMTAAASHPAAYMGCARHCKIGECIKPSQEKTDAIRHQTAAHPKFQSISSVIE